MTSRYLASIVLAFFGGTLAAVAADASNSAPTAEQIRSWIERLDSDDFETREEASRQLVESGASAITAVAEAAASDSQEVAWRAGVILQQIGVSGDERTMSQVIRAMAKLERAGKRSFRNSGAEIIQRWQQFRHDRAVAAVRRLGGEVVESPDMIAGGFGGGFIPALPLEGPVVVDFGGGIRAVPVEEFRLKAVEELEAKVVEARPLKKPVEAIEPLELPKLPAASVPLGRAKPADAAKPYDDVRVVGEPREEKVERKSDVIKVDEIDRFAEELRKQGIDVKPLSLRIAEEAPDREKDADAFDDAEGEVDDAIEFLEIEELADGDAEAAPAPAMFGGGGFGGGLGGEVVLWNTAPSSSRMVRLGKPWKGSSSDLQVLREVTGLATLELHEFNLDEAAIKQIARLKSLERLQLQHSKFDREKLLALKRAKPNLSIYATGKTLLGVAGQPHPQGFRVSSVVDGSAAHKAELQVGDILTKAEGIKLTNVDELTIAIAHKNVGDPLLITYLRNGVSHQVEVKLGPR